MRKEPLPFLPHPWLSHPCRHSWCYSPIFSIHYEVFYTHPKNIMIEFSPKLPDSIFRNKVFVSSKPSSERPQKPPNSPNLFRTHSEMACSSLSKASFDGRQSSERMVWRKWCSHSPHPTLHHRKLILINNQLSVRIHISIRRPWWSGLINKILTLRTT